MPAQFESRTRDMFGAFQEAFRDRDPFAVLAKRTELVDEQVSAVSASFLASRPASFAIAAVGGYGRRELFPYSDIDLLFLAANEADMAGVKEPLSECLRELWDSGLRISHSVRTVEECCRFNEQNTELHVSLLDFRFLCGDRELFHRAERMLAEFYAHQARHIAARLAELTHQRHRKFDNTPYHLEPNIKETCGGIRDLHLLGWFSRLYPNRPEIGQTLENLGEAKRFLFTLRCFLHFESRRDNNLLSFELQDAAAQRLSPQPVSPEDWMRQYFHHARCVFGPALRLLELPATQNSSLWREIRDRRGRMSTAEYTVSHDRVLLRNPAITLKAPESVLDLFTFVGRHRMPLSWDAQRRVRSGAEALGKLFLSVPPRWRHWHELFSQPHCALALAAMQEAGVLAEAIPEWREVESLVVRDFYHRYTVDEHTLLAIQAVDNLLADAAQAPKRFRELACEEDDPALLRLALLLHDIGKGTRPGDHVRGSIEAARTILNRMGAPENARAAILFLIDHHLDLSQMMSSRDLDDPATASYLTSRIGTKEEMRRLALLTYCDISAVNPTAMTPWRAAQLWRTYSIGVAQLTRELATERIHDAESIHQMNLPGEIAHFLEGFPMRYLRTHTRDEIEQHFALYRKSLREGVAIEIRRDPHAWLAIVVAQDQPRLFASLCGALSSFGMNIVKAEAFSNASGHILDLLRFTDPLRTLELNPSEINRLAWTIACVLKHTITVEDLLRRRRAAPRPARAAEITATVRLNQEASDTATLIEFAGEDRPGLLYDLASAISSAGCNIEVVMIDTEAHKALDVFYVTRNGKKVNPAGEEQLRVDLIAAARTENMPGRA